MEYNFLHIEKKWQKYWAENNVYRVENDSVKPKFYVLDMFPYPSGAGLHVGHPLGYIASDIYSRYKHLKGFNVLHPMGYDAFGLPAEQYAIQTGQHPAITTEQNIIRYREQLDKLGFSYDWSREVQTCDPGYYKWTQWAFVRMFNSYYCCDEQQARPVDELITIFEQQGTEGMNIACTEELSFTADEWNAKTEQEQQEILLNYRIAYLADTVVNWCGALGTVLANDEVINGLSERGGHPVEQRKMRQWSLRISAYAQRLLDDLDTIEWTDSLKDIQRYWIGRSEGATLYLPLAPSKGGGNGTKSSKGECDEISSSKTEDNKPGYYTTNKLDWKLLADKAKEHRKNPTQAENILWQALRAKKTGYKFRRQHPIDKFIVDFVYLSKSLIVEVDGEYHNNEEQKQYDEQRSAILKDLGYTIIRFNNNEVLGNIDEVVEKIKSYCDKEVPSLGGDLGEVAIFTTRPDTIFGVTFMVLAPESEWVCKLTTPAQKAEVEEYVERTKKRNERERMADTKNVTGVFTGSYAVHPFTGKDIPIWISEYVLAGYGTGAIMAVPAHDSRDYLFAKHFNLPIIPLVEGCDVSEESFDAKEGKMINSDFLNGMDVKEAIKKAIDEVESHGIGERKVNYRLRDAIFSRQRYWGEPFPVYYKNGLPYVIDEKYLPITLPQVDKFLPTETGEPPLGRATVWAWDTVNNKVVENSKIDNKTIFPLELSTMPGFAGSSAYYLRYMDPHNGEALVSKDIDEYWRNVDLYIGGTEHATGHLVYSRYWNKFLYDIGVSCEVEPFKKLVNQGMIQGRSNFVYRINGSNTFVSHGLKDNYDTTALHVDVNIVYNDILNRDLFRQWRPEFADAEFVLEDGEYHCGWAVEKMSKSMFNVVNPDDIVVTYGADTLRMYEMFLGPLEQSKPWDTKGIDGVHRFLRKFWRLSHNSDNEFYVTDDKATPAELKILHKTIKKVQGDIEDFSFNTSVSAFMICVNELTDLKCNKREILEPLTVLLSPFAPHIAEELWSLLGYKSSIVNTVFPEYNEEYLVENSFEYPISFNGKMRFKKEMPLGISNSEVEKAVLEDANTQKFLDGKTPKKVIVVPGKIVNIVL